MRNGSRLAPCPIPHALRVPAPAIASAIHLALPRQEAPRDGVENPEHPESPQHESEQQHSNDPLQHRYPTSFHMRSMTIQTITNSARNPRIVPVNVMNTSPRSW